MYSYVYRIFNNFPYGQGPFYIKLRKKGIEAVEATGIEYQVTPTGTIIQAMTIEEIFTAAKAGADADARAGSRTISMS